MVKENEKILLEHILANGKITNDEKKVWEKVEAILDEVEGYSSISVKKITIIKFQQIKERLERLLLKEMNHDDAINFMLELTEDWLKSDKKGFK